jgi:predicted phosphodiesterase
MPNQKTDADRLNDANDIIRGKQSQIKALEKELRSRTTINDTAESLRESIFGLSAYTCEPPKWLDASVSKSGHLMEVPLVVASDWHWGETVDPDQVGGMNAFNRAIAKKRVKLMGSTIIDLCFNHMTNPNYPGIVLCLAGDMITGAIHDDLRETNDGPVTLSVMEVQENIIGLIELLAAKFGKVFVPCVPGNHGRTTLKPRAKNRVFDSWEWVIYQNLEKWYAKDPRVTIHVPNEVDAHFAIYGHRFMLTHGDTLGVKGGDGIIGALGPIARGAIKVGRSEAQCGRDFDTLIIGHYHTYIPRGDAVPVLANGSLIGYNEYARLLLRAGPASPKQALAFVHPKWGITVQRGIDLTAGERVKKGSSAWLAWDTTKPKSA